MVASIGKYNFTYKLDKDGNAILCCDGKEPCVSPKPEGTLIIPPIIDGHKITRMVGTLFKDCHGMTKLVLPEHLQGVDAMFGWGCSSLGSIEISKSNPKYTSENGVLYTKDRRTLIRYPPARSEVLLLPTTRRIGSDAFNLCDRIRKMRLPEGVEVVNWYGFSGMRQLETVEFPKSLQDIGNYTFVYCSKLTKIVFNGDAPRKGGELFGRASGDRRVSKDIVVEVRKGSKGWNGKDSTDLPERWPLKGAARPIRYIQ